MQRPLEGFRRAQAAIEATRIARVARESELASARIEHEWRTRSIRAGEQELAGLEARLKSLQELEAARAEYGDAARTVLAQANGKVGQRGAIADYLDVEGGYERAVEACLGDLLQHVIVEEPEQAAAGFQLVRDQRAGRCGFLIADEGDRDIFGRLRPEHVPVPFRGSDRAVVGDQGERSVCRGDSSGNRSRPGLPIHMTMPRKRAGRRRGRSGRQPATCSADRIL